MCINTVLSYNVRYTTASDNGITYVNSMEGISLFIETRAAQIKQQVFDNF